MFGKKEEDDPRIADLDNLIDSLEREALQDESTTPPATKFKNKRITLLEGKKNVDMS